MFLRQVARFQFRAVFNFKRIGILIHLLVPDPKPNTVTRSVKEQSGTDFQAKFNVPSAREVEDYASPWINPMTHLILLMLNNRAESNYWGNDADTIRNIGNQYYRVIITSLNGDGTCSIKYEEDGTEMDNVPATRVREVKQRSTATTTTTVPTPAPTPSPTKAPVAADPVADKGPQGTPVLRPSHT